ncbi:hypothetical protein Aperf_G00000096560 [Anoplocephala perfoliata]
MLRSKLCSGSQGGLLFSCCIAYEDPSEHKIDRRLIGPPMDFRHLAHMGSGGSTSVTSSIISGIGSDDPSSPPAPITTHLKLIDLSEALAVHNAAAAMRASCQQAETSSDLPSPPPSLVKARGSDSSGREHRKSSATSRYLISGPLPPPPPPPPPSALIA